MDESRQQIIDRVIQAAHERRTEIITSEVAKEIVEQLHELEQFGHAWVTEYIDALAEDGAQKKYGDWRRRHRIDSRTKKGTEVDVPAYAGVRTKDDDGKVTFHQMRLEDMTLPQLEAKADAVARTRDTLSVEYRFYSDLIEMMRADASLATVGDAIAKLEAA